MTLRDQGKPLEQRYRVTEAEAWRGRCKEASSEDRVQAPEGSQYSGEHPASQRGPRWPWKGRGDGGEGRKEKGGGGGEGAGSLEAWDPLEHTLETT